MPGKSQSVGVKTDHVRMSCSGRWCRRLPRFKLRCGARRYVVIHIHSPSFLYQFRFQTFSRSSPFRAGSFLRFACQHSPHEDRCRTSTTIIAASDAGSLNECRPDGQWVSVCFGGTRCTSPRFLFVTGGRTSGSWERAKCRGRSCGAGTVQCGRGTTANRVA